MPSAYRFTQAVDRAADPRVDWRRSTATAATRASSPGCRSTSRGACPTCRTARRERHYVQALYHLTKTLDPTRPVIGNDGWESVATDIIGIHDYDDDPERIARRYARRRGAAAPASSASGPGGRLLVLERTAARRPADHADRVRRHRLLAGAARHLGLLARARRRGARARSTRAARASSARSPLLAGFCYTQFADTYQEANGLLYADRTPKFPLATARRWRRRRATPTPRRRGRSRSTAAPRPHSQTEIGRVCSSESLTQAGRAPPALSTRRAPDRRHRSRRRARRPARSRSRRTCAGIPLRGEWVALCHATARIAPSSRRRSTTRSRRRRPGAPDRAAAGRLRRRRVREPVPDA